MKYLLQYETDNDLVSKIATAKEVVETFGYSDFNCANNIHVFALNEIGVFAPCKIVHSHSESVDDYGHLDMWCEIVDVATGETLDVASYEEH